MKCAKPKTIGSLFPFEDKVTYDHHKSLVVYKISCKTCGAQYIGMTEQFLQHRINENKGKGVSNVSACRNAREYI